MKRVARIVIGTACATGALALSVLSCIPTKTEVQVVHSKPYYEHDPVNKGDFAVYYTNALGVKHKIYRYEVIDVTAERDGIVELETPFGTTKTKIPVVAVKKATTSFVGEEGKSIKPSSIKVELVFQDGTKKSLGGFVGDTAPLKNPKAGKLTLQYKYYGNTYPLTVTIKPKPEPPKVETEPVAETAMPTTTTQATTTQQSSATTTNTSSSDPLTPSKGVVYYAGHRETYYSQKVLPGQGLSIPGRHVASDGTIRDEDGYICVASSDLPKGTVVETSLGTGKVYDSGCPSGTIDIYTNW